MSGDRVLQLIFFSATSFLGDQGVLSYSSQFVSDGF